MKLNPSILYDNDEGVRLVYTEGVKSNCKPTVRDVADTQENLGYVGFIKSEAQDL